MIEKLRRIATWVAESADLSASGERMQRRLPSDVYDHTIHVIETIESYRDLNAGMLDTYLSVVSNRMNEVMKTLTIIATLFIPLTFIAGIYGMNFEHMPELKLRWAYPLLWAVMVTVAIVYAQVLSQAGMALTRRMHDRWSLREGRRRLTGGKR